MATTRASDYRRLPVPDEYAPDWMGQELMNVQRAISPTAIRTSTISTAQLANDRFTLMDATAGARNYTLLAPSAWPVFPITVKKIDASANAVTLVGTVDGVVNPTLAAQYVTRQIISDGVSLWFVARNL